MSYINENFLELQDNYLFSTVAKKVSEYSSKYPNKKIIKLGIGDVTRPIVPACVDAMHKAVEEVGTPGSGFGPSGEGYFRLTAFGTKENTIEAMDRIKQWNIKK